MTSTADAAVLRRGRDSAVPSGAAVRRGPRHRRSGGSDAAVIGWDVGGHVVGELLSRGAPRVSVATFEALRRGELDAGVGAGDRATLMAHGLLDEFGTTSAVARSLAEEIAGGDVLQVAATDEDGVTRRARLIIGRDHLVAVLAAGGAAGGQDSGDGANGALATAQGAGASVRFEVFPVDAVPLLVARWWGIVPHLPVERSEHGPWPEEILWHRLTDPGAEPPVGADDEARALWAVPWRAWSVHCHERGVHRTYVDAGAYGTFLVRRDETGAVSLLPRPSSLLWGDLQAVGASVRPGDPSRDEEW